jgi:hypothetical protein
MLGTKRISCRGLPLPGGYLLLAQTESLNLCRIQELGITGMVGAPHRSPCGGYRRMGMTKVIIDCSLYKETQAHMG